MKSTDVVDGLFHILSWDIVSHTHLDNLDKMTTGRTPPVCSACKNFGADANFLTDSIWWNSLQDHVDHHLHLIKNLRALEHPNSKMVLEHEIGIITGNNHHTDGVTLKLNLTFDEGSGKSLQMFLTSSSTSWTVALVYLRAVSINDTTMVQVLQGEYFFRAVWETLGQRPNLWQISSGLRPARISATISSTFETISLHWKDERAVSKAKY